MERSTKSTRENFLCSRKRTPQIKLFLYFGKQKSPIFLYISENGAFRVQKMKRKPKVLLILWEMEISSSTVGKKIYIFLIFCEKIDLSYCSYFF